MPRLCSRLPFSGGVKFQRLTVAYEALADQPPSYLSSVMSPSFRVPASLELLLFLDRNKQAPRGLGTWFPALPPKCTKLAPSFPLGLCQMSLYGRALF